MKLFQFSSKLEQPGLSSSVCLEFVCIWTQLAFLPLYRFFFSTIKIRKTETQQNRDTEKQNTENKTPKNIKSKNRKEPNKKTQQNRKAEEIRTHMFLSQTNLYILLSPTLTHTCLIYFKTLIHFHMFCFPTLTHTYYFF